MTHREPYVGEGVDGARRSAQIDREEADGYAHGDPRRDERDASANAWDRQANELEAATGPLAAIEECGCSDEYGPCEDHGEVKVSREGASLRSADELAVLYIQDAKYLLPEGESLSPYGKGVYDRVIANLAKNGAWITDAPGLSDELYSVVDQIENNIGTAGFQTYREDGYRIVRITGGPLADDDPLRGI